ncbi:MAG: RsmE family RNA methyltransferase, partial [Nitrospirae bacterium]|nr:RsmE family RNA methyltransferase [Nitrospirota bacterium]
EFILQKAAELGVNHIYPLKTERSFLACDKALSQNRLKRWERIVSEATKQCGRADVPVISAPQTIDHFLEETSSLDIKICLWEGENQGQSLRDFLKGIDKPESVSILIGPEGSFSICEIGKIRASGYQTLTCGPRIMRVETAAITCMAICQYEWGDL